MDQCQIAQAGHINSEDRCLPHCSPYDPRALQPEKNHIVLYYYQKGRLNTKGTLCNLSTREIIAVSDVILNQNPHTDNQYLQRGGASLNTTDPRFMPKGGEATEQATSTPVSGGVISSGDPRRKVGDSLQGATAHLFTAVLFHFLS